MYGSFKVRKQPVLCRAQSYGMPIVYFIMPVAMNYIVLYINNNKLKKMESLRELASHEICMYVQY